MGSKINKPLTPEEKDTALTNAVAQRLDRPGWQEMLGVLPPAPEKIMSTPEDAPAIVEAPQKLPEDIKPSEKPLEPIKQVNESKNDINVLLEKRLKEGLVNEDQYKKELEDAKKRDMWVNILQAVNRGGAQIGAGLVGTGGLGMSKVDLPEIRQSDIAKNVLSEQKERASRMQDLLSQYQKTKSEEGTKLQQTDYVTKDGVPLAFDPTGKLMNLVTKEIVNDPSNIKRKINNVFTDPNSGEKIIMDSRGNTKVIDATGESKTSKDVAPEVKETVKLYSEMSPRQKDEITKLSQTFSSETKDVQAAASTIDGIIQNQVDLAVKNPIQKAALGAQMARLYEKGVLTDKDVERYTTRAGVSDRIKDAVRNMMSGTIPLDKAEDIKEALRVYKGAIGEGLHNRAVIKAQTFSNKYGTDPENTAKLIYGGQPIVEKVKMQFPDGKVKMVPKNRVDEFKKLGGTEL